MNSVFEVQTIGRISARHDDDGDVMFSKVETRSLRSMSKGKAHFSGVKRSEEIPRNITELEPISYK